MEHLLELFGWPRWDGLIASFISLGGANLKQSATRVALWRNIITISRGHVHSLCRLSSKEYWKGRLTPSTKLQKKDERLPGVWLQHAPCISNTATIIGVRSFVIVQYMQYMIDNYTHFMLGSCTLFHSLGQAWHYSLMLTHAIFMVCLFVCVKYSSPVSDGNGFSFYQ